MARPATEVLPSASSPFRMHPKRIAAAVRSLVPRAVRSAAGRVGKYLTADLPDETRFPSIDSSLRVLRALGFSPRFAVDVGAYRGDWTKLLKAIFPQAEVLMVEPQDGKRQALEQVASGLAGVSYENALLAAREGETAVFHEMETGSSIYPETSPYPRTTVAKATRTLDGLLTAGYPAPDLIKLDVQGFELEVLRGGTRALSQCEAVLMEVSLVPVNSGCPLFAEVVAFLGQHGFSVFDFCSQIRRRDGVLWQTDLLFLRANSRFAPKPELTRENWG